MEAKKKETTKAAKPAKKAAEKTGDIGMPRRKMQQSKKQLA